uniref:Putative secreted protein n=1 Tax=Ixodes scapularis TaxID=6945 RepID=A0A4D5RZV3_IXOSC
MSCAVLSSSSKVFKFFFLFLIAVLLCWWSITSRSRVTCNQGLFRFFLATRERGSPFRLALENYLKGGRGKQCWLHGSFSTSREGVWNGSAPRPR